MHVENEIISILLDSNLYVFASVFFALGLYFWLLKLGINMIVSLFENT